MKPLLALSALFFCSSVLADYDYSSEQCESFKETYSELEDLATRGFAKERDCANELKGGIRGGNECREAHILLGEYLELSTPLRASLLAASKQPSGFDCDIPRSGIVHGYVREVRRVNALRQPLDQTAAEVQETD